MNSRRALLAKIHIAKKALAMEDAYYRALLRRETGLDSAGKMSDAELQKALAAFQRLGWNPAARADDDAAGQSPHGAPAQRRKIAALLKAGGKPAAYGEAVAKRMHNKPLAFCSPAELRGVIAALNANRQRQRAAAAKAADARSTDCGRGGEGTARRGGEEAARRGGEDAAAAAAEAKRGAAA
ncbi:MAG: regulatory protein GemA [Gammaproteobacteria bacterium]|nr:regulatory protein GemA [Gammaproteobacteria bacterium]